MRLLKLRVKNIASLRGEHTVSFEDIAAHSNLFAITGETGAGKSTILNAIGLALYGDIFKKTLNQIDVVTLGESEGLIELIFQVKGKKYLAYWYVRTRKPNGEAYAKTPTPTRYLYTLNGHDFSDERIISDEKIEDLLHLDFDQFTKCVVLNQGEFAKFLMSSFADRRAILEKLYPGEVLGNVVKVLKDELDSLRTQRDHIDIELKAIQDDGTTALNIEEELKVSERELSLHEKWYDLIEKLNTRFTTLFHYHQKNLENLKRIETTKQELASGTTTYNVLLKATEEALLARDSAQKIYDERGPRLQELLKSEQDLRNDKVQLETSESDEKKKITDRAELEDRLVKLREEEALLGKKRTDTVDRMKFPPEGIISHRDLINQLVDRNDELEKLTQTLTFERDRFHDLENRGKETATKFSDLQNKLKDIPEDSPERLKLLLKKREDFQKTQARLGEVSTQSAALENSIAVTTDTLRNKNTELKDLKEELTNVLSSLKVQELLSAVSVCLFHPQTEEKEACPVCEAPFGKGKLEELRTLAGSFNTGRLQDTEEKLKSAIVKLETEIALHSKDLAANQKSLTLLQEEKTKLTSLSVSPDDLEKEISETQKHAWDREQLLPQLKLADAELARARTEYKEARAKLTAREEELRKLSDSFLDLGKAITEFVQGFHPGLLSDLRQDLRLSVQISEFDGQLSRVRNDVRHLTEKKSELTAALESIAVRKTEITARITSLSSLLQKELQGESAAETLKRLHEKLKAAQAQFESKDRERQKQDLELKALQAKLYTYDEQARDIGLQYAKEHKEIAELASADLPELSESLSQIILPLKRIDLPLSSPTELFIPVRDLMEKERALLKTQTNEARSKLAHLQAKKSELEKKRDRIQLLELKRADLMKDLARRERMNEILGKDELRTYVLSLVEENLIIVTNEELSRLCQGRYEIIHQTKTSKLAPEFFILDKFRDGGIRKVSTLSGGETFMVSLAMALGLAEMTRGTAEIDTLFIDEGFGTLDHESLEDVLDVLNQIQNRGLMVGIISHVKQLTDSLPANVALSKKRDGTSSISLRLH